MIEKIVKMISNLKILSKMNEIIDGLNTHAANTNNPHNVTAEQLGLATAYVYKGSVTNFSDLPTNAQNGWVYSVENEHTDSAGILHPAGANFAWNGSKWDDLGGSLSGYAKSVNSQTPDNKGNVKLTLVESLEKNTEDKLVVHNSDGSIQELEVGKKYTINNKLPDANDNYDINEFEGYWESNESVSVGDVRFLKGRNNTKYLLECVQSGITGTEQPTISEDVILADYSDNTRIGTMRLIFNIAEKDDNEILATGILYTRAVYTELWDYISSKTGLIISEDEWQLKYQQTGGKFVPYYSSGDGTSTFRTPLLNAYARGTDSVDNVGNYLEAGLPNIVGSMGTNFMASARSGSAGDSVGIEAFKASSLVSTASAEPASNSKNWIVRLSMDASDSNAIYGNSNTVTPETMQGIWVIKAFGIITNNNNTDISNILSGITNVETRVSVLEDTSANKDLSNLGDTGKKAFFPSDTFVEIANYTGYVCPANGYVFAKAVSNTSGVSITAPVYITIENKNGLAGRSIVYSASLTAICSLIVKKGDIVDISFVGQLNTKVTRFYYAECEV